ncbi:MAG: branched-chain amino acid aminotransferase [Rhodospirillaceae bacterium]
MGASFDDRDGFIWMNGQMVAWRDAKVHVLTHALHYASSVFEGERAYGGKVFKLEEHTDRLFFSARTLDMEIPFTPKEINDATYAVLKANNQADAYVRPIVWRGSEMMGVAAQDARINVAITSWVWGVYFSLEARLKGVRLQWADYKRPSPETAPVKAKAAGLYMICTVSKHKAEREGFDDAMFLDWRGQVAEATGANVFFVMNGEIHTPAADCFLDGITRRAVMEMARKRGYKVIERAIFPNELAKAQECFLTGTAAEVTPVRELGQFKFTPGEVCRTLMADFDVAVGKPREAKSSAA